MADEQQLAHAIDALTGNGDLPPELIGALSHLVRTDLEAVSKVWRDLPVERRLGILRQLSEAERVNARHDFNAIYEVAFIDESAVVRQAAIDSIVAENGPSPLETLVRIATSDPDANVRQAAIRSLGPFALMAEVSEIDDNWADRLRSLLLGVLEDKAATFGERREALSAVGYVSNDAVDRRLQAGFDDDDLQIWAIQGMGHTANPDWIDTLLPEAVHPDPTVRQAVAYACGDIADERAAEALSNLVDDEELGVRLAAIWALGQVGGETARETLIYALEDERDEVRTAAEEAISELEESEDPLGL
jgi:HEAT repeat protein